MSRRTQLVPGHHYDIVSGNRIVAGGDRVKFSKVRETRKGVRIKLACGAQYTVKHMGSRVLVLG